MIVVKNRPPAVMGYMSPYPTVVRVTTAHHKLSGIEEKRVGWTVFSK
jgi:hypothetical protein